MCLFIENVNIYLIYIIAVATFLINIVHIVLGLSIKINYFNISDIFDSSPLFDFSYSENCEPGKSAVVFHKWGGRKDKEWTIGDDLLPEQKTVVVDETDIKQIYGKYFCYKKKSYKELLYNGQIIKKGEQCPSAYQKNCGRLDTLEQELCIKEDEKCPLYDARLVLLEPST